MSSWRVFISQFPITNQMGLVSSLSKHLELLSVLAQLALSHIHNPHTLPSTLEVNPRGILLEEWKRSEAELGLELDFKSAWDSNVT